MAVLIFVTDRQPGSLITRRDPTLDIADAASAKGPWITPGADPISRGDPRLRGASEQRVGDCYPRRSTRGVLTVASAPEQPICSAAHRGLRQPK
jgi:hypothetical protein